MTHVIDIEPAMEPTMAEKLLEELLKQKATELAAAVQLDVPVLDDGEDATTPTEGSVKDSQANHLTDELIDGLPIPPWVRDKLKNLRERMRLAIDAAEWRNVTIARLATDAQRFSQLAKRERSRLRQAELERTRMEGTVRELRHRLAMAGMEIADLQRRLGLRVG